MFWNLYRIGPLRFTSSRTNCGIEPVASSLVVHGDLAMRFEFRLSLFQWKRDMECTNYAAALIIWDAL